MVHTFTVAGDGATHAIASVMGGDKRPLWIEFAAEPGNSATPPRVGDSTVNVAIGRPILPTASFMLPPLAFQGSMYGPGATYYWAALGDVLTITAWY